MKMLFLRTKIIGVLIVMCSNLSYSDNVLNKIEFHRSQGLEIGKLSVYFTESQNFGQPKKLRGSGQNDLLVFSVPATINSEEIRKKINQLNNPLKNDLFKVSVQQVRDNVQISFEFDPQKIDLEVKTFKAIKMERGVNFIIINKELLNQIHSKKDKAVITTAQLQKKQSVLIDCGHGGRDSGTISCFGKAEKDVTLGVGLEVVQLLNNKGIKTGITRNKDIDLALDQRTKIANNSADLFLSIHANSSSNKKTTGIETYCLDESLFTLVFSTLKEHERSFVAFMEKERCKKSNKLAHCVHKNAIQAVSTIDRHVRSAVSQVLIGTDKPAILIEIGFLSNEREALLLADKKYQHLVAQGICDGVMSYLDSIKSA